MLFYLTVAETLLTILLMAIVVACFARIKRMARRLDLFMMGPDGENLEKVIKKQQLDIEDLKESQYQNDEVIRELKERTEISFQKMGMVKFNAFDGMGGDLSFVLAMLNLENSGFILSVIHSREGCYIYLKDVIGGTTEVVLGAEEKEALERALGYSN